MGHDWGFFAIVSYLPKYMSDVLQFSMLSNGIMTALPFIALWLSSLIFGFLADWLIRTRRLTLNAERKVFTFISKSNVFGLTRLRRALTTFLCP